MKNRIYEYLNLTDGEETKQKVLENVNANISFRGSNLWILACAIIVASIGLNVNSTAVIIGAMLISPLMGPIIGAGFALGTYDSKLLKRSGKNLLIATVVSLFVSTTYFYLSPFKETQSELLARTSPNIYDVLIAFFGGLVGIIAITRVEKGNPIPGVAIATALMPPLCTTGYALAMGNFQYMLGAFYLYIINCFFICIATFFVVKYLKYPAVKNIEPQREKRIHYGITALILVIIVPSVYLAYNMIKEKKETQDIENFITQQFSSKGYTVYYKKINLKTNPKLVELAILNKKFSNTEKKTYDQLFQGVKIKNAKLVFIQGSDEYKEFVSKQLDKQSELHLMEQQSINELKDSLLIYKKKELKFNAQTSFQNIIKELNILFPEMQNVQIGDITTINEKKTIVLYSMKRRKEKIDEGKIINWLSAKGLKGNIELLRTE